MESRLGNLVRKLISSSAPYSINKHGYVAAIKSPSENTLTKRDAKWHKVCTLRLPVLAYESYLLKNRNGNSNVKFKQAQTMEAAYEMLERKKIQIERSHMDFGSFTKEIDTVEVIYKKLYIRRGAAGSFPAR